MNGYEFSEKWKTFYMRLVYENAAMSKDQSTHVGAVVVGPDKEVRSMGYNSFPRGMIDNDPAKQQRPNKYFFFEHAERNAVYNATLSGTSLKGCTMFTGGIPCADCGRSVIQSGINHVVIHSGWPRNGYDLKKGTPEKTDQWTDSLIATWTMFRETGVTVELFNKELGMTCLFNGEEINV